MLHPRLTPVGATFGGSTSLWLAAIGPYGSWGDLSYTTRWGDGASGMFDASWTMPLPADFSHPLLRRGTLVELMDGPYRVGSPLIMSEPAVGSGLEDPWTINCTGIGREVEGENSFYAIDGSGDTTTVASTAVDRAIADGLRWGGRDATIYTSAFGPSGTSDELNTIAALLNAIADFEGKRWGVGQDNIVGLRADPTTPTWHVTPDSAALGTADDDYATVVLLRYLDSTTGGYETSIASTSAAATQAMFGRKEFAVDVTSLGAIAAGTAAGYATSILAKTKGRLAWVNGLTLTANELLTAGGVPASLSMVEAGQMIRIHGIFSDLLAYNGQTWLDIIIGETKYVDGDQVIQVNPMGMAKRDLASIVESVTGIGAVAA